MSVAVTNTYYDRMAELFNLPKDRILSMKIIMDPCCIVRIEIGIAPTKEQVDELMDCELKLFAMMELQNENN